MDGSDTSEATRDRRRSYSFTGPGGSLPLRPDDQLALDVAMLVEGETSGRPLEEVLARFGRSRTAYYEKLRRFREEGASGLVAKPPGPHGPWRRSHEVVRFVVTARLRDPSRSPDAIARDLSALGHDVSVRSVERTLQQFGLTRARTRRAARTASTVPEAAPAAAATTAAVAATAPDAAAKATTVPEEAASPAEVAPELMAGPSVDPLASPSARVNAS
jgi:transposase